MDPGEIGGAWAYTWRYAPHPMDTGIWHEEFDGQWYESIPRPTVGQLAQLTITHLMPATKYYFAVRAQDASGNYSAACTDTITTSPEGLLHSQGTATIRNASVTIKAVNDLHAYFLGFHDCEMCIAPMAGAVSIADPGQPLEVAWNSPLAWPRVLKAFGRRVYLIGYSGVFYPFSAQLYVIPALPESPLTYGSCKLSDVVDFDPNYVSASAYGNYIIVGAKDRLTIVDVADSANPQVVRHQLLTPPQAGSSFALAGDVGVVLGGDSPPNGPIFTFLDMTDLTDLRILSTYDAGSGVHSFLIEGSKLYFIVQGAEDQLKIVDLSDPSSPKLFSSTRMEHRFIRSWAVQDRYAFIGDGDHGSGIRVFDVGDLPAGSLVDSADMAVAPSSMLADESYLYVTDDRMFGGTEIHIFAIQPSARVHMQRESRRE